MANPPDLSEFDHQEELVDLRRQVTKLQGDLRRAKNKTADFTDAIREGSRDAAVILGNPPPVKTPPKDTRKGTPEVALIHLSDWQTGKKTDSYNSDVTVERIERLTDKVIQMTEIERSDHPVPGIEVFLGGDMVEGTSIFPLQAWEIDSTTFQQVNTAKGILRDMFRRYLETYEYVSVWQEEGNHGRTGRKNDNPAEDNWDLILYQMLADYFEGEDRITFHPRQGFYQICPIGNYTALLVHGDEIKGFGGLVPAYAIQRKVNMWAAGSLRRNGVVQTFDDCYMGHFHSNMQFTLASGHGRIFVNPSTESDSIYAQEMMAANGRPGQRLNFIDPEAGQVTSERVLWLD